MVVTGYAEGLLANDSSHKYCTAATPLKFALGNIWTVYDAVLVKKNKPLIDKITSSLGLKWLPLAAAVLGMVVRVLPSPRGLSRDRLEKLMCAGNRKIDSYPIETQELVDSFISCSPEPHAPVIVFISKMFLADLSSVHETQTRLVLFLSASTLEHEHPQEINTRRIEGEERGFN
uniref:Uncharacterized protein n=1 Tax=Amphimedon queenslandica TaxID=400682 RepID=A0A1X7UNM7_AMPQE